MSYLQTTPLAILCSDLHLRETTPRARAESDWYEVMAAQLSSLWEVHAELDVPIICAGDVFDKWNPSSKLVSFAITHLPPMYAITGQHDLEGHRLDRRFFGAYGALCKALKITDIPANEWFAIPSKRSRIRHLWVWAMPWGAYGMPTELDHSRSGHAVKLGVLHQYRWSNPTNKYAMAEDSSKLESLFPGLDALLIGDNHIPWELPGILNHGGFIAQNADQKDYQPHYGVLYADGHIERKPYNTPAPQWLDAGIELPKEKIAGEVIEQLNQLQGSGDSFADRLKQVIQNTVKQEVKKELESILQKVME